MMEEREEKGEEEEQGHEEGLSSKKEDEDDEWFMVLVDCNDFINKLLYIISYKIIENHDPESQGNAPSLPGMVVQRNQKAIL